jgi:transcription-repair coupling factor (superfamily II helicase)
LRLLAAEMLRTQALRASLVGFAFSKDGEWQKEFESRFPYKETPDQLKATLDTKEDMEAPRPMDRLICGDVGYGKTEVAMRAAFKAVTDGKQVAILVPTTILAEQHYYNFTKRLEGFPVKVGMLSRFRTRHEQQAIIKETREGKTDILIGTHRLLSKDVSFKDLGLVVIDEEQRFGVRSKEKLKHFRLLADVMTLTATPIPRTLYMALAGARDMSIISSPPTNRLAVKTRMISFDEDTIRQAIKQEMDRGGQVFFLHNRVENIDSIADGVRKLAPEAKVAVAHGQMSARFLEGIMLKFLKKELDILVCTTIIESGIDVPLANTLIVNHADKFGLADLHQLRGRVGRLDVQAYAYFIVPRRELQSEIARQRLKVLEKHSDLGAGFHIAFEDLQIRGAGNLLGAQQHGFITSIGFDLYCRLLKESIEHLKRETDIKNGK